MAGMLQRGVLAGLKTAWALGKISFSSDAHFSAVAADAALFMAH